MGRLGRLGLMTSFALFFLVLLTASPGSGADGGGWRWPLGPPAPAVVRGFAPPAVPWGAGHRGVDLAARPGLPVFAAGAGRVSYAGRLAGRGVVAINHGTLRTTYLPVVPSVRVGGVVSAGSRIGVVEDALPPHCALACLHWGLRRGAVYLNPLDLVQRRVRLLPRWSAPPTPDAVVASRPARSGLRAATTGGALVTGMLLAFVLLFLWRQVRLRATFVRRRAPAQVIDLARERRLRRAR
ncbi:Peptidase family M23 [Actinomadura rubteroloni]|uniref:Peptidase family M23 n=2 Tax=Actinomadura rubteroloni TaxID=1926885 RepID=A0A2P4UHL3_9ACTN|nr:Peptidase family M23 [Actinomadura rubteroloni]